MLHMCTFLQKVPIYKADIKSIYYHQDDNEAIEVEQMIGFTKHASFSCTSNYLFRNKHKVIIIHTSNVEINEQLVYSNGICQILRDILLKESSIPGAVSWRLMI